MNSERKIASNTASIDSDSFEPPSSAVILTDDPSSLEGQNLDFQRISDYSFNFLRKHFPTATIKDWNNWRWQLRNSFTSLQHLQSVIRLSSDEMAVAGNEDINLPIRITPYYASLIANSSPGNAIRKTMVPVLDELIVSRGEESDPLDEHRHNKVKCLIHRYPDRVLFLITNFCSAYCRYCTRSHMVGDSHHSHGRRSDWDEAIEYIRNHPEIRDVLLSGGDPLTLPDEKLKYLLSELRAIKHVEIIRIGTKVPVVLPQRITPALLKMLRKYHPVYHEHSLYPSR